MDDDPVQLVQDGISILANLPEEVHWLCEKIEKDADGRTVEVEYDKNKRSNATQHAMMILSFSNQEQTQTWLKRKVGEQLVRCARCVQEFYTLKRKLYFKLLPDHGQENLDMFFEYLNEWDIERIEPTLSRLVDNLDRATSIQSWFEELKGQEESLNSLYECFCGPDILKSPVVRTRLKKICSTKMVKIQRPAAALICYLFLGEEDSDLRSLAEESWVSQGPRITRDIFETHLLLSLEAETRMAEVESNPVKLSLFFRGISTIVKNLNKEIILRCISGAEKDPIGLGVRRIQPNLQFWPALLRLFQVLMTRLHNDVWEVIAPCDPTHFSDMIYRDKQFGNLLRTTEQSSNGESQLLDLTEWMSAYVNSLEPLLRPNAASSVVEKAMESDLPPLSKVLCLKEAIKILGHTLCGAESVAPTGNILVRSANSLFIKHLRIVKEMAFSNGPFGDPLMEKHMVLAKRAAQTTNFAALRLGFKFMETDCLKLSAKAKSKPVYNVEISSEIWDSIARSFPTDNIEYCKQALEALRITCNIDRVYLYTGQDPFEKETNEFNKKLERVQVQIADVLKSLSRCSPDTLEKMLLEATCNLLFSLIMSRFDNVAEAAEDILLTSQKSEDKTDALRLMVVKDLSTPMQALTNVARSLSKTGQFARAPRWIKTSMLMIEILCDRTQGVIRVATLQPYEKTILKDYWIIQWHCLGAVFKKCRRWAIGEHKEAMIGFLRDAMDYGEQFFDQFWTYEQALRASIEKEVTSDSWSDDLLAAAAKVLTPFTTILSIQDEHLLQTCQKLMCKMLGLLDQKLHGEKREAMAKGDFFINLKKYLYPEAVTPTNLTEVQKTELAVLSNRICPDFIPPAKEVIELSDDDYDDIPDEDMLKTADSIVVKKTKPVQSKLDFPAAARPSFPPKSASKGFPTSLRIGLSQASRSQIDNKREAFLAKRREDKAALEKKRAAAKKTTPTAVVLSDSEGDSSSDEDQNTLFKLGTRSKTIVKDAVPPPVVRKVTPRHPVIVKRAKDIRARVPPDMSPLYKQIFKWDFFHEGPFPPGSRMADYTSVRSSFETFGQYKATFEPLLLLEAWQSFLKCKEEAAPSSTLEVKISTRLRADYFVELTTTVDKMDDRQRWQESDIVLLSSSPSPLKAVEGVFHCIARVSTVKLKRQGPREVSLFCDPGPLMLQKMTNGGTLWGIKIMGLTPLEREYAALICLQYYDLRKEILTATPQALIEPTESQITKTQQLYNVNEPQAKAIISATTGSGFTLIQGPPGTGKTKTVIGIVGALLTPGAAPIDLQKKQSVNQKKILVCAPSNAAVDELVIRFKQGVRTTKGDTFTPNIVRIGRSDAINAEVKDVTLEDLIDARIGPALNSSNGSDLEALRTQKSELYEKRNAKQAQLDDCRSKQIEPPGNLLSEVDSLNVQIRGLGRQIGTHMDQKRESSRTNEITRRHAQQEVMNSAQIICATLSGSGHEMLRNVNVDFETVIIDEAAQSVELSALIPLKFGCEKCILVGDPQQLPPTVLSRVAAKFSYEKSLFVRMQENHPQKFHLLSIQYRMHPLISSFPSQEFYKNKLLDGPDMAGLRKQLWHNSSLFGPYKFFNVHGKESRGGTSLVNRDEVIVAMNIFSRLTQDFNEVNFDGRIGIVTPYRQQLFLLKQMFQQKWGEGILKGVEFNTVDAFQGRERDIIIFSCVRAADEGGVGFLSDVRRMNVGLTRAKSSLFVLGNSQFLVRNVMWKRLIDNAKTRDVFVDGNLHMLLRESSRITKGVSETGLQLVSQPASNAPSDAPVKAEVDFNRDPMDIDEDIPSNTSQVPVRVGMPGSNNAKRQNTDAKVTQLRPQLQSHSPRSNPNFNLNITCHNCGEVGHRQNMCQQKPKHMVHHDPRIPVVRNNDTLKRPHELDRDLAPPGKRLQGVDGTARNTVAPSSSNTNVRDPSNRSIQAIPTGPKKGVIKRKSDGNPLRQPRPNPRPPSGRPPN